MQRGTMMEAFLQDVRYAVRTLARSPGLVGVAVLSLGLGIGVCAVVFSCVNALYLRPYPYREPSRLVAVFEAQPDRGINRNSVSYANFADWRAGAEKSFEGLAAHDDRALNLAGGEQPESIEAEAVSWNTFRLLGVTPMLGRDFLQEEEGPTAAKVAILSYQLWERVFQRDSGVVGRGIILSGRPYTVVGVVPPPHHFPEVTDVWIPMDLDPTLLRGSHFLEVFGRLRDGVTPEQAQADLNVIASRLATQFPATNRGWTVTVGGMRDSAVGEYKPILAIMMAAVGFVLLIACANVANLLLARASGRSREIALRGALGASRVRIVRQLLTESVLLSVAGAGLGVLVATWGLQMIVSVIPADKPFWMVFTIDGRVLAFTMAVAVGTGILFGLAPALQALRTDLHESLKEGGRGVGTGTPRHRLRNTLVVSEVALSTVLLIGAALMIRSFLALQQVRPGFDQANLLTFIVSLQGPRYDSTSARGVFYDDLLGRLRAVPGVVSAGTSSAAPLLGSSSTSSMVIDGQPAEVGQLPFASLQSVSAGFVSHLGVPFVEGRDLTPQDLDSKAPVALVSKTMAERFWPNESALGKRFKFGVADTVWLSVVGVTGDVRHRNLSDRAENQVYVPYTRLAYRGMNVQVRTGGHPAASGPAARAAVRALDPTLPVVELQTMDEAIRFSMWEQRLYSSMFGAFAAVALLLAAIGLYGVMSYLVSLRTHEIGVRMALGAGQRTVLGLVVGRGVLLAGIGLVIGVAGAFGMTRVLQDLLFGVGTLDPLSFAGIPLMLAAVAALASYVPARRASGVDPVVVLRSE